MKLFILILNNIFMENSVIQRLKMYFKDSSLRNRDVANKINMPEKTFNNKMSGLRGLDLDTLTSVLLHYGDISAEWLLRGEGNMNKSEEKNSDIHIMYETSRKQILLRDERIRDLEIELELANTRCEELKKEVLALKRIAKSS